MSRSNLAVLRLVAFALWIGASHPDARAIVVARPPAEALRNLSRYSDRIVVADALDTRGAEVPDSSGFARGGWLVWTETRVVVRESWKGTSRRDDTLAVWTPGGAVPGGRGLWIEDAAKLEPGGRYVLFLD